METTVTSPRPLCHLSSQTANSPQQIEAYYTSAIGCFHEDLSRMLIQLPRLGILIRIDLMVVEARCWHLLQRRRILFGELKALVNALRDESRHIVADSAYLRVREIGGCSGSLWHVFG